MIAVRLSAQCTDARVNLVTPALFARYPDAGRLCGGRHCGGGGLRPLLRLLQAQGAGHRPGLPDAAATNTAARCPDTMDAASAAARRWPQDRQSAAGRHLSKPGSVVCDTHCIRICNLLGLASGKDPAKVEQQLRAILPPEESSDFCHRLVLHGRAVCVGPTARSAGAADPRARTAEAFRGNEHACPFYVKSLKFNRSW